MKRLLIQIISFLAGFAAHFAYSSWGIARTLGRIRGAGEADYILTYSNRLHFITGITWGLVVSFAVYAVTKYFATEKRRGVLTGTATAVIIFIALYFLFGCNGTMMFNFYTEKVGWFYASMIEPIILLITIISTVTGYILISKRTR